MYLHLRVKRYSDLLSKLDLYAFLSSFFFYILIFHSLARCLIFFFIFFSTWLYQKLCFNWGEGGGGERERESLITIKRRRKKKSWRKSAMKLYIRHIKPYILIIKCLGTIFFFLSFFPSFFFSLIALRLII